MRNTLVSTSAVLAFALASPAIADMQWYGEGYLGYGSSSFTNTDDDEAYAARGALSYGGVAGLEYNGFRGYIDAHAINRSVPAGEDFDDYFPEGAAAYGIHLGYEFNPNWGSVYVGGFYGRNRFQGDDASSTNGYVTGDLRGIETEVTFGNTAFFAQFGTAEMVGDVGDTAFDGQFQRVGVAHDFDSFSVIADYERGRSDDIFEDRFDWGEYNAFGLTVEAPVTDWAYGYVTISHAGFIANTEDEGSEDRIEVGLRMNFGEQKRTNLTTTYNPGLAAAWAETLD